MKRTVLASSLSLSLFLLFFCGVFRHDINESVFLKLANEKQFDCVGRSIENGQTNGTGILITPNYVLSAGHILLTSNQLFTKKKKLSNVDPADFQFEFNGKKYKAKRIIVHPDLIQKGIATGIDLMLVELVENVDDVVPAILSQNLNELHSEVTGVGFGISGIVKSNGVMQKGEYGKKTAGKNIVDELSGTKLNNQSTLMAFDFDSPTNPSVNKMGDAKPLDIEYTPTGGDSGGGLFRQRNNKWELIGILHSLDADMENFRKNGYYGEVSRWTRVSLFVDWIEREMK
ncbi:MAG: trypsin-like serine protease [Bacteroidota bacterium]